MRAPVDRDRRHRGNVAEELVAFRIEQRDVVQAANVPGEAQFQRLPQFVFAVAFAFRRLVDEDGANAAARPRGKPEDR